MMYHWTEFISEGLIQLWSCDCHVIEIREFKIQVPCTAVHFLTKWHLHVHNKKKRQLTNGWIAIPTTSSKQLAVKAKQEGHGGPVMFTWVS